MNKQSTPNNSIIALTRTNIDFPWFTVIFFVSLTSFSKYVYPPNLNYVCQYVTSHNKQCTVVQYIKYILKQPCELFPFLYTLHKTPLFSSGSAGFHKVLFLNSFIRMSINLLAPLKCSLQGTCISSPSPQLTALPVTTTVLLFFLSAR